MHKRGNRGVRPPRRTAPHRTAHELLRVLYSDCTCPYAARRANANEQRAQRKPRRKGDKSCVRCQLSSIRSALREHTEKCSLSRADERNYNYEYASAARERLLSQHSALRGERRHATSAVRQVERAHTSGRRRQRQCTA